MHGRDVEEAIQVGYWTVIVPYTAVEPTEWHPTDRTGPFAVLQRGSFKTRVAAVRWAKTHLATRERPDGMPYSLRYTPPLSRHPLGSREDR